MVRKGYSSLIYFNVVCVYNDIFYKVRIIFFYIFSNNTHLISFEKPQFYEIIKKANSALSLSTSVCIFKYLLKQIFLEESTRIF